MAAYFHGVSWPYLIAFVLEALSMRRDIKLDKNGFGVDVPQFLPDPDTARPVNQMKIRKTGAFRNVLPARHGVGSQSRTHKPRSEISQE